MLKMLEMQGGVNSPVAQWYQNIKKYRKTKAAKGQPKPTEVTLTLPVPLVCPCGEVSIRHGTLGHWVLREERSGTWALESDNTEFKSWLPSLPFG